MTLLLAARLGLDHQASSASLEKQGLERRASFIDPNQLAATRRRSTAQRHFHRTQHSAVVLQSHARMRSGRVGWAKLRGAAMLLQSFLRERIVRRGLRADARAVGEQQYAARRAEKAERVGFS